MGHSVNAITFRLGKSLLWRLLLVNPISLNFFFFNFSRSFLTYYRYINYLFKIKYFKIFYKKGFFFSHLTLRRSVVDKYVLKLYVLDTFFLRLKSRFKAFLLGFSTPLRSKRANTGRFKKDRSATVTKKFISRKRRGYPTYFFKKILRSRSNRFSQTIKDKNELSDFLSQNDFKIYESLMSGQNRNLFGFFNSDLNFFFFYHRNSGFLNLKNFFAKSAVGFLVRRGKRVLMGSKKFKRNGKFVLQKRIIQFKSYQINKAFPIKSRFFCGFPSQRQIYRGRFFQPGIRLSEKMKRTLVFRSIFLNFRRNLKLYTNDLFRFFGYNIFRVYKYRNVQEILKVVRKIRRFAGRNRNNTYRLNKRTPNYTFSSRVFNPQKQSFDKFKSLRGGTKQFSNFNRPVSDSFGVKDNTSWQYARKRLTFFNKVFFFRIVRMFSNFFGAIHLGSDNFVKMLRLLFVVFFKKFINAYCLRLKKIIQFKSVRRLRDTFKFKLFFKRFSRKLFLQYYFSFTNFFVKIFRLRKSYAYFRCFSKVKRKNYKFFFRFNLFIERLIFFLSVTSFRYLVRKNIKKHIRYLYSQITLKFARFLQFKLARLTNCKNLANLSVQFTPLSCFQGITPDVYVNFLRLKIRRRFSFKSLIRPFIKGLRFMRFLRGVYGLGNGRFTRRQRASTVKVSKGKISFSTVSAYLLYSFLPVITRFGTCGVHIFFNFKKSKVKFKYKAISVFKIY